MEKYTKERFKSDMQQFCICYDPVVIAKATSKILFQNRADIDLDLEEKMLDIIIMEDGPEFEMTEEEFKKFLQEM